MNFKEVATSPEIKNLMSKNGFEYGVIKSLAAAFVIGEKAPRDKKIRNLYTYGGKFGNRIASISLFEIIDVDTQEREYGLMGFMHQDRVIGYDCKDLEDFVKVVSDIRFTGFENNEDFLHLSFKGEHVKDAYEVKTDEEINELREESKEKAESLKRTLGRLNK